MASDTCAVSTTAEPRDSAAPPEKQAVPSSSKKKCPVSDSDEHITRELCTVNGLSYEKVQSGGGLQVKKLEIFFFSYPRVVGMHHFPNLTTLCVVNQDIWSMAGLEACRNLEELWICEGNIAKIECLSSCSKLVRLFLYTNKIERIEGLASLTKLEKLWLNGNKIKRIEGLETLIRLTDLNLAGNEISAIGRTLECHHNLQILNLSGNRIAVLKDLVHLSSLQKLQTLSLCEPSYPPCPACQLCNYSTHVLYHLPQLNYLDGKDVSSSDLHKLVQGLVAKKKQFYRMKLHHATQLAREECESIRSHLKTARDASYCRMKTLHLHLKTLQYEQEVNDLGKKKSIALSQRLSVLEQNIDNVEGKCSELCEGVRAVMREECERWRMELESGGNIKFTPGDPSLPWYKSCLDLVGSRFTVADVQDLGISGIQIRRVVRVENRQLYNRFNETLKCTLEGEPYSAIKNQRSYRQLLDYLFLIWQPGLEVNSVCQNGCHGGKGTIVLTNSVTLADHPRIQDSKEQERERRVAIRGMSRLDHLSSIHRGQLVLCKAFIGHTLEYKGSSDPSRKVYPTAASVYRQKAPPSSTKIESQQREWFVFNHELVLPEYIIEFDYTSQLLPSDPLGHVMSHDPLGAEDPSDEELLALEPALPVRPRLAMLDESTVRNLSGSPLLSEVQSLVLHDNRLSRFRLASSMPQLTKLVLCFNDLTSTEDLQHMPHLEYLDVSFNRLSSLESLRSLPRLTHLDVSWNELTSYHNDVIVLRKHTPSLESLDARYNTWTRPELFRSYALGRLKSLRQINGYPVSQEESSSALRQVVTSHLSLTTLLGHAHTDTCPPQSLTLTSVAEMLHKMSRNRPLQLSNSGNDWCSKVTSVSVCGLGLRKLTCLDHLPNLCWLSLDDNALTNIEGLTLCTKLRELTIDRNLLQSLDLIHHFSDLKWLSASDNSLTHLPSGGSLGLLEKLEYLNVCRNQLGTLEGLQHLSSLTELYASGNKISNLRELFHLKPLIQFAVLELVDNPITRPESKPKSSIGYRMFAVYHLPLIKALDGQPVDSSELAAAKEKLGGRLTLDVVYECHSGVEPSSMRQLDLPNRGLKRIDLHPVETFSNLASLNLEHNSLTSFSGLVFLNHLKVLCLNHNRVECLVHSRDAQPSTSFVLNSLEVLHLAYNGISNLVPLSLGRMPSLRALFLQGNEITRVDGMDSLENLTELILDRNKIKGLQDNSFSSLYNLRELHVEENRLRDLSHFAPLMSLERLYLGMNRVQEYAELEKLGCLQQLMELSVISNPVSRRMQHRSLLIFKLPSLRSLDGVLVTSEERQAAEISFSEIQEPEAPEIALPGLTSPAPLKVMNVPVPFAHPQGAMSHSQRRRQLIEARTTHLQSLQQTFHEKWRGRR